MGHPAGKSGPSPEEKEIPAGVLSKGGGIVERSHSVKPGLGEGKRGGRELAAHKVREKKAAWAGSGSGEGGVKATEGKGWHLEMD